MKSLKVKKKELADLDTSRKLRSTVGLSRVDVAQSNLTNGFKKDYRQLML